MSWFITESNQNSKIQEIEVLHLLEDPLIAKGTN